MINIKTDEKREKEDIKSMLNSGMKKSEICKALGINANILNEKIRKYKLKGMRC